MVSTPGAAVVVLKGRRGQPCPPEGPDEILDGAWWRAGLSQATCHQLRHTFLARLREAGMGLEASRPRPGMHRSSRPRSICI